MSQPARAPDLAESTTFPEASDFKAVDDCVLEYLLFRGFTRSFRAVAADCKADKIRSFDSEKVRDMGAQGVISRKA